MESAWLRAKAAIKKEKDKKSREKRKDKKAEYDKYRYENNKQYYVLKSRARRREIHGMQYWKFRAEIEAIYTEARRKTEVTGVLWVVDHIWPVKGKNSCGLHVPWNLRIITGEENDRKGNKEPEICSCLGIGL